MACGLGLLMGSSHRILVGTPSGTVVLVCTPEQHLAALALIDLYDGDTGKACKEMVNQRLFESAYITQRSMEQVKQDFEKQMGGPVRIDRKIGFDDKEGETK